MSETGASSPDDWVPPGGILEELDGSPIRPPSAVPPSADPPIPWRHGFVAAAALTVRRPRLWVFALVAFLARGGLAALALPIVVLPTFVGLANFVGPASVSAEGPGPRLMALVALGVATGLALAVAGAVVGAAAEVALHRATVATAKAAEAPFVARLGDAAAAAGPAEVGAGRAAIRVAALRLLLLVPVAAVATVAVPAWVAAAYRELTLPSDVATPLVARVLAGAPVASAAVLGTWLAAEVVGGFAARRAALLGASIPGALAGGLLDPLRVPLGTALTVAAALATSILILAPGWWAVGAAWDVARHALAGGTDPLAALGAALLLAATWLAVLALAAIAAAGRATLVTMELLRRRR
ncbi:MAG: hypothetical protein V2B17_04030 [Chloroflexota bacterium]